MLPHLQTMEITATPAGFLPGDDSPMLGSIAREKGPIALYTGTGTPYTKTWIAANQDATNNIYLYPEGFEYDKTILITPSEKPTNISLAFNQDGYPFVSYFVYTDTYSASYLYWYDPNLSAYTTLEFLDVWSPILTLDDKRDIATIAGTNDVMLFYKSTNTTTFEDELRYRQQRDDFQTEYVIATNVGPDIVRAGMTTNYRLQVQLMGAKIPVLISEASRFVATLQNLSYQDDEHITVGVPATPKITFTFKSNGVVEVDYFGLGITETFYWIKDSITDTEYSVTNIGLSYWLKLSTEALDSGVTASADIYPVILDQDYSISYEMNVTSGTDTKGAVLRIMISKNANFLNSEVNITVGPVLIGTVT